MATDTHLVVKIQLWDIYNVTPNKEVIDDGFAL